MSIILELQQAATSSDVDILNLLRKAYLVARKLKLRDFTKLIDHEMNGYGEDDDTPQYRYHQGPLVISNPYNGEILALNSRLLKPISVPSRDSIASLQSLIENSFLYNTK